MPVNTVLPPLQLFTGADGQPLEGGYIFIGEAGFEARSTPKASFFDAALTIPTGTAVGAGVRTSAGYPLRNGLPATIYVDGDHSITVTDKNLRMVFAMLNRTFQLGTPTAAVVPIVAPDGNLLTTGFGFIAEPDTGLVRSATATMQIVVDGTPVFSLTPGGIEALQPMRGAGVGQRRLAQGTLSGADLIYEVPTDIDGVVIDYWRFLPSTAGQDLKMQIGSGTIGSPVWGAAHAEQGMTLTSTTPSYFSNTSAASVSASLPQIAAGTASGRIRANGFQTSGSVEGEIVRRGLVTGPARAFSSGSFSEESAVTHTLIRLFVAAGTMAGSYRIEGYRKP
jgi:hypothetical protein